MTELPLDVDLVVVTYRSSQHLPACLDALGSPSQVLVVDNASDDDSAALARSRGCRVIENPVNVGFGRAVNQAMDRTAKPFVLLLNPDAVIAPAAVAALRASMEDETVGAAASRLVGPDGVEQRPAWPFPSARSQWAEAFGWHRRRPARWPTAGGPYAVESVVGACMMVRRAAFIDVGGFDERFWLYGEETDWCRRAADRGWRRVVVPEAVARHVGGASAALSPTSGLHFRRGSDRFVLHHEGAGALASYRLALLVGSLLRIPPLWVLGRRDGRLSTRRAAVRYCATELLHRPRSVAVEPLLDVETVVVCSLERWDDTWRRNQLLVHELVRQPGRPLRVLFVEPPDDVMLDVTAGRPFRPFRQSRPVPTPGAPGVTTFRPVKRWPRMLGPWADRSLVRQLARARRDVGMEQPALWINDSVYAAALGPVSAPVLYDITDDWLRESVSGRERRRRRRREERLLARADGVVVCSPELAADRGARRPVTLISNGVDVDFFRRPQPRPEDLPAGPVAVYVGTLHHERIDVALIERCATHLPDVHFVFVGPNAMNAHDTQRLGRHPNVHVLGPRPYPTIPAYLQHADVIVVPHRVTPFTESLDPIKAYECRAVGRPTLATPVAGFRGLAPPVEVARTEEYPHRLAQLLEHPPAAVPDDSVPTWADQARRFREELTATRERRLRVVFIGHTARLSGGELALCRLLEGLVDIDAHVILGEDGPLVERLVAAGATVEVLALDPAVRDARRDELANGRSSVPAARRALRSTTQLRRRLVELHPDLVHTNTLKAALYGGVAARLGRVPVIWHVRDRVAPDYLPGAMVRFVRSGARVVPTWVIANSQATMSALAVSGARRRRVTVVHDAVPADFARAGESRSPRFESSPVTIAIVGRLAPWKGQDVFIRALAAAQLGSAARAMVVGSAMFGEDGYAAGLAVLVHELGLDAVVEFRGFEADVAGLLAEVDIAVHASTIPEPFGQVVIEAMAAGCAVIAADAGGPAEIVTHGVDGLLVAPGDVAALADAIARLAANAGLRERLGYAARQRAASFTPERMASQVRRVYDAVLRTRR